MEKTSLPVKKCGFKGWLCHRRPSRTAFTSSVREKVVVSTQGCYVSQRTEHRGQFCMCFRCRLRACVPCGSLRCVCVF